MRKSAISGMEFLAVVIILFVIFMILIDLALFFRQTYLLQTSNDEIFTKIEISNNCLDASAVKNVLNNVALRYFNKTGEFKVAQIGGGAREYSVNGYSVIVKCKNTRIEGVSSKYRYDGIFMFKNKVLNSSYSSGVSYY